MESQSRTSGNVSRSVHTRNLANKGGNVFYQRSVLPSKLTRRMNGKKQTYKDVKINKPMKEFHEDTVIVGHPPKVEEVKVQVPIVSETRFTIPEVPMNGNLIGQTYMRTHNALSEVVKEIHSKNSISYDHEIEEVIDNSNTSVSANLY
eukprot:gene5642-7789_t